ncbi:reverse transcriptase domain-containing protein, partial [Tanacetum coccineum]
VTNPKEDLKGITTRSRIVYQGPTIPTTSSPKVVERKTKVTKDTVFPTNNKITEDVQPPIVAPVSTSMPNPKLSIPYPSRRNDEKRRENANEQKEKFYEIFKDMGFEISFVDTLTLMPKFASTLKALIKNKEKLSEIARTPLNEQCSTVILNKLPEKLGDPGRFLIPCKFPGMDERLALADLGASINLMPFSVWKKLNLPNLTPTCMTLELVDRSISRPIGIAKDVDKCRIHISVCTDKSKNHKKTVKKTGKHGHENQKSTKPKPKKSSLIFIKGLLNLSQSKATSTMVKAQWNVGFCAKTLTKEAQCLPKENDTLAIFRCPQLDQTATIEAQMIEEMIG